MDATHLINNSSKRHKFTGVKMQFIQTNKTLYPDETSLFGIAFFNFRKAINHPGFFPILYKSNALASS